MTSYGRIAIIYNPNSTGNSRDLARELKRDLAKIYDKKIVELVPTEYAGHAEILAREIANSVKQPLIISASGDGGYNEVLNGVMKSSKNSAVCAVLPAGNANDHSRTMHSKPLLELIKEEKVSRIDLLKMTAGNESRYAHSYIGLGITPVIAADLNKHDLNAFKEIKIVLQRFYKYRPFTIQRGGRRLKLNSLLFANINQMAKILTLAEKNRPDDGKFEVVTFPAGKKRNLIFRLFKAAAANLETTRSESSYGFKTLKKMPVQLDGEVMTLNKSTKVKIESAHKALRTLI